MAQNTGEKVDAALCRAKFNHQDQELEVDDCQKSCQQQQQQSAHQQTSGGQQDSGLVPLSDAPSIIGPQTAPSVLLASSEPSALPPFLLGSPSSASLVKPGQSQKPMTAASVSSDNSGNLDLYTPASPSSIVSSSTANNLVSEQGSSSTTERSSEVLVSSQAPTLLLANQPNLQDQQQQQQMSCSNCTSDEICLLLMTQKVPFCAKVKDRSDESRCGGWCKAQNQLCQAVGQNAFKCIHDSECLAEEWRCHDSGCVPLANRCDGHANCYDSSDERDCPI